MLYRVTGAGRLSDGRIVVAEGGSLQLKLFEADGAFIKNVGGRGGGPGEFRRLDRIWVLPGDTIAALSSPGTVTFFSPDGRYIRRINATAILSGSPTTGLAAAVAVLGDQSLVTGILPRPSPRARGSRWVDSIPLVVIGRDTAVIARLGPFPYMLMAFEGRAPRPPWFAPVAMFAASDTLLYVGYGSDYTIRVVGASGVTQRIIRRRWEPKTVNAADIEEFVSEWSKQWIKLGGPEAAERKQELRDSPYAETIPAYAQLIVDRARRLWVREARVLDAAMSGQLSGLPLSQSVWSVFDLNGIWLSDVTMPARFLPTDVGRDYVLGVAVDADGVETVVQYSYEPPVLMQR